MNINLATVGWAILALILALQISSCTHQIQLAYDCIETRGGDFIPGIGCVKKLERL